MGSTDPMDRVAAFTEELLRTGCMLSGLVADLVEALPPDEYPGEAPAVVVLEMVTGTISTALDGVDQGDVERATELIAAASARVLAHLQLALERSRRLHEEGADHPSRGYRDGADGPPRGYG